MTQYEKDTLAMMTPKEQDLLLRVLALSSCRDGAIVSLVAECLRAMVNSGLMDRLYPVEPVVTSSPSMEVGDIVIANWNIADTPGLNGQVVKILVFEGDQACVKDPSGTISVFNVKNLRPIPKDF